MKTNTPTTVCFCFFVYKLSLTISNLYRSAYHSQRHPCINC